MRARRPARSPRPSPNRWSRVLMAAVSLAGALLVIAVLAAGRGGRSHGAEVVAAAGTRRAPAAPLQRGRPLALLPEPCDATELRRDTLRDDLGRPYYLTPDAMHWSGDTLLVAGQLSARLPGRADAPLDADAQNAVLAVLQFPDGSFRAFARPAAIGTRLLQPVRVAPLGGGRWAMLLVASIDSLERPKAWLAVLSASGWERATALDLPPEVQRLGAPGSPLDVRGEELLAAVPIGTDGGAFGVLLVDGSLATPRVRRLPNVSAAYAAALLPGGHGAGTLVIVHADETLRRDENSMFVRGVDDETLVLERLVRGGDAPVHHPSVASLASGLAIAWRAYQVDETGRTRRVPHFGLRDRDGRFTVTTLGPDADRLVLVPDGSRRMLTVHTMTTSEDTTEVMVYAFPEPARGLRLITRTAHGMGLGAVRARGTELIIGIPDGTLSRVPRIALALIRIDARCALEPAAPAP